MSASLQVDYLEYDDQAQVDVTIMYRNDELSSTMSWGVCLLTDLVLPDTWKLKEWE